MCMGRLWRSCWLEDLQGPDLPGRHFSLTSALAGCTASRHSLAMRRSHLVLLGLLFSASHAQAGMTVYDLNDVVRLRLEDISFFTVLLLACALGIRFLWNYLAKDLPRLPRLSYGKALCLTGLLSL